MQGSNLNTPWERDGPGAAGRRPVEEELRALVRQKEAVAALGLRALSGTELSPLMQEAVELVARTLGVEYCRVLELQGDGEHLLLRWGVGWEEGAVGSATVEASAESQAGYTLISGGKTVVVEDLRTESRFDFPALLSDHRVVSGLSVTIYVGGRIFGVLGAHAVERRTFTEGEASFLGDVAAVLGAAIERGMTEEGVLLALKERVERMEAAERRFTFLSEANALLSSAADYMGALTTAARFAVPALADWCFVDVIEAGGDIHRFAVAYADPDKRDLARELHSRYPLDPRAPHGTAKVMRTGKPEIIPEVGDDVLRSIARDDGHLESLRRLTPRSYMCLPLQIRGQLIGAMGLISAESGRFYGEEDVALAEGLARCAALAIYDARLHFPQGESVQELAWRVEGGREILSPRHSRAADLKLTRRQGEVLGLLSSGKSVREIGEELHLSQATVRNHVRGLLQALGARSQLELLARARQAGLLGE